MSWTKRQQVEQAFASLGLGAYVFDLDDAELVGALVKMDAMLSKWEPKLRLGYASATQEVTSLNDLSGVPDAANEAVYTNLALRIAPDYGKVPSPDLRQQARESYNDLLSRAAKPIQMQYPQTLPRGSGNRRYGTPLSPYYRESDPLTQGGDGVLGDITL